MSTSSNCGPCSPESNIICNCGLRCKVATSMTLKNPMRRFVHCRRHGDHGSCDFFKWVDESLDERVRSMVVGLMLKNERMAARIHQLENQLDSQKRELSKMKEKNGRMKMRLQKLCMCCVAVFMLIVAFSYVTVYIRSGCKTPCSGIAIHESL